VLELEVLAAVLELEELELLRFSSSRPYQKYRFPLVSHRPAETSEVENFPDAILFTGYCVGIARRRSCICPSPKTNVASPLATQYTLGSRYFVRYTDGDV